MAMQNVLMVGIDEEQYERFAPMLQRKHFDVDRFPSPKGALELVTQVPFSAIIVHFPVGDLPFEEFLQVIRSSDSASKMAPIGLLSDAKFLEVAKEYLKQRVQLVVSIEEDPEIVDKKISALLGIKSRAAVRTLVKLDIAMEDAKRERFMAQSKDISASGMFVTTKRIYPVGSRAHFEFTLPNDSNPFAGTAEVMRHAAPKDRAQGFAIKYVSFSQNSQENLAACLKQLIPA